MLININLFITGAEVPKQKPVYHKKIDLMKLDHALDFIFNPAFHQVSSVGTKEMRLEDGSVVSIPEYCRCGKEHNIWIIANGTEVMQRILGI